MDKNIKRHKFLKLLANERKDLISKNDSNDIIGISREKLMKKLRCSNLGLNIIISEPILSKEIDHYDRDGIKGFYLRDEGFKELVDRKYIRRFWKYYGDKTKKAIDISIPVLSLIVAIIAVSYSKASQKENLNNQLINQQLQEQINNLEQDYKALDVEFKTYIESNLNNSDSVKIE